MPELPEIISGRFGQLIQDPLQGDTWEKYCQHLQNYQNNYFRAEVGKELPKQFPGPFPVGKQGVGNLALSYTT